MRSVPAAITAARESASSRLVQIWEVTRSDNTVLRFTEHDRDIEYDGETYLSTASYEPSSIKANADMSVGDMDVKGAFAIGMIEAADVIAGKYHGASFWVGELLWDAPEEGIDVLKFGWLGRCKEIGGQFAFELLGPSMMLQHTIGEIYSPTCRATLGDSRCGVDLVPWTVAAAVESVASRREFTISSVLTLPATRWQGGLVTWTSGANAGLSMEIQLPDDTDPVPMTLTLFLPMPFDIEIGDECTIVAGCDKTLATCRDVFNNVLNFRGEPHVPVSDDLIRGPGPDTPRASGGSSSDVSPPATPEPDVPTISGNPTLPT